MASVWPLCRNPIIFQVQDNLTFKSSGRRESNRQESVHDSSADQRVNPDETKEESTEPRLEPPSVEVEGAAEDHSAAVEEPEKIDLASEISLKVRFVEIDWFNHVFVNFYDQVL